MAEIRWHERGLEVRCRGGGFAVSGAGFYVFDERLPAALEHASLLRAAARPPEPPGEAPAAPRLERRQSCESPS